MSRKEAKRLKRAAKAATTEAAPETSAQDTSTYVHQREALDYSLTIRERKDWTERQRVILEAALDKETRCMMIDGLWGTGKTTLATLAALKLLNTGRVKQILYVRNPIEASANSKLGFIPGGVEEKMAPYNAVLRERLDELLTSAQIDRLIKDKRIECLPTGYLQGRSFNCTAIIVDEAASMSWEDLLLLLTRCGPFTRVFLVGDTINQLYAMKGESGFARLCRAFDDEESRENGVAVFELKEPSDIVRSGFVRFALKKAGVIRE